MVLLCRSLLRFLLLGEAQLLRWVERGVVVAIVVIVVVLLRINLLVVNRLIRLGLTDLTDMFCWSYNSTIRHQLVVFEHYLSIMRNSYFSIYLPTFKETNELIYKTNVQCTALSIKYLQKLCDKDHHDDR